MVSPARLSTRPALLSWSRSIGGSEQLAPRKPMSAWRNIAAVRGLWWLMGRIFRAPLDCHSGRAYDRRFGARSLKGPESDGDGNGRKRPPQARRNRQPLRASCPCLLAVAIPISRPATPVKRRAFLPICGLKANTALAAMYVPRTYSGKRFDLSGVHRKLSRHWRHG
jgi:hypothetical protein